MARNTYRVTPDRPFIHSPIDGPDALKAGAIVDASDVLTQIVTLAGHGTRRRIHFRAAVAGSLTLQFMQPYGRAASVYAVPVVAGVAISANTDAVLELDETVWQGEAQAVLTFTGSGGIVTPGAITFADISGT